MWSRINRLGVASRVRLNKCGLFNSKQDRMASVQIAIKTVLKIKGAIRGLEFLDS
jgi:hypothetical protein